MTLRYTKNKLCKKCLKPLLKGLFFASFQLTLRDTRNNINFKLNEK